MKSIFLTISGIVILSLSFFALNKMTEMKQMIKVLSSSNVKVQRQVDFLNLNFELNNNISGKTTPDILCKTLGNEEHYLSEFVSKKSILICRYTSSYCSSCSGNLFPELTELHNMFADHSHEVVVFAANHRIRELYLFIRRYEVECPVYSIDDTYFNWHDERINGPYCFVLHPDMRISNVFVLDKAFPELNKQYLEGIKRLLSE